MDSFGVVSPKLKAMAKKVNIPNLIVLDKIANNQVVDFMGAKLKSLNTLGEQSATGMSEIMGVLVVDVAPGSEASNYFQPNDVILALNDKKTNDLRDFLEVRISVIGSSASIIVFRNQKEQEIKVKLSNKK